MESHITALKLAIEVLHEYDGALTVSEIIETAESFAKFIGE